MRGKLGAILLISLLVITGRVFAQCPAPDFTLAATACREQNLSLTNLSTPGTFEWDYCSGDLSNAPTANAANILAGTSGLPSFEYAKDGDKWYAFVTGTFTNRLYRVTYDDPTQAPALTENLGDLGGKLNGPGNIRIIKHNGNWFGLLHNVNNGELLKLSFGNSLGNNITTTSLFTGIGGTTTGFSVGYDGANGWVCVLSTSSNNFRVIRLGENLTPPTAPDILVTAVVPNPNSLFDVDLVRMCDQWFAFATNLGNGNLYRLSFGTSLFQQPAIDQIGDLGGINTGRLRAVKDGEDYYLLIASYNGGFFKVGLGDDLADVSVNIDNEGTFSGLLQNTIAIGTVFHNSTWTISVVNESTGGVYSIKYPNSCSATELDGNVDAPHIRYSQQGTYNVTLKTTNGSGISSTVTKSINITSSVSPDINFTTQNVCAGHNVTFTPQSVAGGISTYDWNFGDATAHSSATQPNHIYAGAGEYEPSLSIVAANGCTNNTSSDLKLYDEPVAAFTTPAGLVCTNNEYTIVNNTTGDYDGILEYSWTIDGDEVSTSRDLLYTFSNTGDEDITLEVSIPGCSDDLTKPVNDIDSGPTVAFISEGQCEGEDISFSNGSTGSISGYLWTFDDGETSDEEDPDHAFEDPGVYSVALSTTGTNGCVSAVQHDVTVFTSPQPSLSIDLPPFSCSGTPSQLHDATGSLPDSNIQTWNWTFGDGNDGTGKNPLHTYADAGQYSVGLEVITDKGCTGSTTQQVTITQSPTASFNEGPACVGKATRLSDTSTGNVATWQWKIGSAIYTSQDAQHTFAIPGSYSVQLNVTGQNGCTNTITQQVVVPVVPTVVFEQGDRCAGQLAEFIDLTSSASDPVVERDWTFGTVGTATGSPATFTFAAAGTFSTQLEVTTESGCVYSGTQQVTILSSPVASFTMSDQSGPPPLHITFTSTSTGAASYNWNFFDGTPSNGATAEHTYGDFGDHAVDLTVTNTDGCSDTESKVVTVVDPVNELALTEFSLARSTNGLYWQVFVRVKNNGNYRRETFGVTYDIGGTARFRETVVGSLSPGEEKSFFLANQFSDEAAQSYICVELDNDTDPGDNRSCNMVSGASQIFNVSPNPATDYLNIETITGQENVRVRIFAMSGGLAFDRSFEATGYTRLSLDIQDLSPGLYVVIVSTAQSTTSQRILIAR